MRFAPPSLAITCLLGMAACASAEIDGAVSADGGPRMEPWKVLEERQPAPAIENFLDTIDGLHWESIESDQEGYSAYLMTYEQPLAHEEPEGRSFPQRIILHHRNEAAPMVLYTSGYSLFREDYLAELTVGMEANQLNVEQRFFGESRPAELQPEDWTHLRIEESAGDHHRIVEVLSSYYQQSWISSGHSKGGMTSIYHRRFHPEDVDATVAYVAPISFGAPDSRYQSFTSELGSSECRQALRAAQVGALERFAEIFPLAQAVAEQRGLEFQRAGGHAMAFEAAIAAMEWSFWQDWGMEACTLIPGASSTDAALFDFVRKTVGIGADDVSIGKVESYYMQASGELGYPRISQEHLSGLLKHQSGETDLYPAGVTPPSFDPSAMLDIDAWLNSQSAARILFVYGESDPWTGGAFDTSSCGQCPSFTVAGQSHGALLEDLSFESQDSALNAIERWTGVRATLGTDILRRHERVPVRFPPALELAPVGL